MELVLKETIDTLGEAGDMIKVKAGYGRNFLIPQGKAVLATKSNIAILKRQQAAIIAHKAEQWDKAEKLAAAIAANPVIIERRTGEGDRLYGSITSADIADALAAKGIEVDKRKIILDEPIKTLGSYQVSYKTGYQMVAEIKIEVVPDEESER
ncbi:MAG: 50S ribosomal protein L9 [Desulfobulbaceae bacterium]|nr:MAG: 50S ribosomal protein L9 [Desulfobulbaceae bacterium]